MKKATKIILGITLFFSLASFTFKESAVPLDNTKSTVNNQTSQIDLGYFTASDGNTYHAYGDTNSGYTVTDLWQWNNSLGDFIQITNFSGTWENIGLMGIEVYFYNSTWIYYQGNLWF